MESSPQGVEKTPDPFTLNIYDRKKWSLVCYIGNYDKKKWSTQRTSLCTKQNTEGHATRMNSAKKTSILKIISIIFFSNKDSMHIPVIRNCMC